MKRDLYEGGHHVPLVIRWPGVTHANTVSDALVSQVDFMATLAAMIGFKLPPDAAEDSHNLLPLLQGEVESVRDTHVHNTRANRYAIRQGDWLLVNTKDGYVSRRNEAWETKHGYKADDEEPVELYNLKNVIAQKTNLATKHPGKVAELQALLEKIREQGHSAPRF